MDFFYLASASRRRFDLLRQIGFDPLVLPQSVDEARLPGESPPALVQRLARKKAEQALAGLGTRSEPGVVLAADTAVIVGDDALGKPADSDHAEAMLDRLRGRSHEVLTGVCLVDLTAKASVTDFEMTRVRFRDYDDRMIRAYVATGEPLDKAGAYGIQGIGALLAEGIEGSWSNVVGLPVERIPGWLTRIGADLYRFTRWGGRPR